MSARVSDDLRHLADLVARLSPSWQQPERFHEAKSEIVAELRRAARALDATPAAGRSEVLRGLAEHKISG